MPTIQVEANFTRTDLLRAAQLLPADELRAFVGDILGLQAQLQAPRLPARESELMLQVNQGLPAALEARCRELILKRRNHTLSEEERRELVGLTEQVEQLQARRAAVLAELAQLRHTTLAQLMRDLGIQAPTHE
jgi:hypothetical protein